MYWIIKLSSGALVLTSNSQFNKMKPTEYLSAEKIEFRDAIVKMFELQKEQIRSYPVEIKTEMTNEC